MSHTELLVLVTASYLASLWLLARWRRFRRRVSVSSRAELARPDLDRVLAAVETSAGGAFSPERRRAVGEALKAGDWVSARACLPAPLPAPSGALLEALIALVEAAGQRAALARHRAAVRGLRAARAAAAVGAPANYLEAILLLAFLRDEFTADLRLWQSRRVLARALLATPADPLLQLAEGLRWACAGEPAEAVAALARALYHARGDRFVIGRVLAVPLVAEFSPGLIAEARRALAAPVGSSPSAPGGGR